MVRNQAAERIAGAVAAKIADLASHGQKHLLPYIGCVRRLQAALPAPAIDQRTVQINKAFPGGLIAAADASKQAR